MTKMAYEMKKENSIFRPVQEMIPGIDTGGIMTHEEYFDQGKRPTKDHVVGRASNTMFDIGVERFTLESKLLLGKFLEGQVLVDLGAGSGPFIPGYEFAEKLGASAYVAVEPYFAGDLLQTLKRNVSLTPEDNRMDIAIVPDDMLRLLQAIPSDSNLSVFCSGIDETILERERCYEVGAEIQRVIGPGNYFIKRSSDVPAGNLQFALDHFAKSGQGIYRK